MISILANWVRVAQQLILLLFVVNTAGLSGCSGVEGGQVHRGPATNNIEYSMLPAPKVVVTPEVVAEVRRFTRVDRRFIGNALDRGADLIPDVVAELENYGIHRDLLNLAIIESGLSNTARSQSGAVGLWQFIRSTARVYGLEVSFFRDDRKDHILATRAAARHLRDLYLAFNDWPLALAAYNAGPAAVDRAISRYGTRNFWMLCRRGAFRRETQRYVPKFFAVKLIRANNAADVLS